MKKPRLSPKTSGSTTIRSGNFVGVNIIFF
jgi:hypothetical protein